MIMRAWKLESRDTALELTRPGSWGLSRNRRKFRRKTSLAPFPVTKSMRHSFPHIGYLVLIVVLGLDAILSENNCLASTLASAGFAHRPEKMGVPAYNP